MLGINNKIFIFNDISFSTICILIICLLIILFISIISINLINIISAIGMSMFSFCCLSKFVEKNALSLYLISLFIGLFIIKVNNYIEKKNYIMYFCILSISFIGIIVFINNIQSIEYTSSISDNLSTLFGKISNLIDY